MIKFEVIEFYKLCLGKHNTMKNQLSVLFIFALLFGTQLISLAQPLSFSDVSFEEALKRAKKSNCIAFIQLDSKCVQCDEVAYKGLSGSDISQMFEKFICVRIDYNSEEYEKIAHRYRLRHTLPTSLFVDKNGCFLNALSNYSSTNSEVYIKAAQTALDNIGKPPFREFVKKYKAKNYDNNFLKDYIFKLQKNLFITDDLVDEYVGSLTVNSLLTINQIWTIYRMAPIIDSRAYKLYRFNSKLFSLAMDSLAYKERVKVNRLMIVKSKNKAFEDKDLNYANTVSYFIRGIYDNYIDGRKNSDKFLLDYYQEVKDTNRYVLLATRYYNQHFKNLDIDSIAIAERSKFYKKEDNRVYYSTKSLKTGTQINNMVWAIYEMTDDPEILGRILKWSERILAYEFAPFTDTYAHVLYKIGNKEDALKWEKEAVIINKTGRFSKPNDDTFQKELEKMEKVIL